MTFLEWEIYYRHELEEATGVVHGLIKTGQSILPQRELQALRILAGLAEHVIDRGYLDEDTNKWKVE